jgi:serine phosphatase RsbU (regulator of sigma subunit)
VRLPVHIAQTEIAVAPGDIFVLHSDGIYETANERGDLYGLDRLASAVARSNGRASDVLASIVDDVTAFRGPAAQEDDVTVVVAIVR